MTVIGMKIAIKREEIEILTLIGASPWYIRMPFIIEGATYGFFGAFISWIISTGLLLWLRGSIYSFLSIIPVIRTILENPTSVPFLLAIFSYLGVLWITGSVLGSLGSLVALGRYLKHQ
jgi:cell division transport system permease protein